MSEVIDRAVISRQIRHSIRTGTPGTALGRIWQKHAVSMLDALEATEAENLVLRAALRQVGDAVFHAAANNHYLDRDCQGVPPGERVPAVRAADIVTALEGGNHAQ